MIYICPDCGKEYETEQDITKHFMKCWKDNNPHHKSKPAPRSADINVSTANDDIIQFFNSLKGEDTGARDIS